MSTAEHDANAQLESQNSNNNSVISTPSNKAEGDDIKDFNEQDGPVQVGIPKKPLGEYMTIFLSCLMVAFGGYVFGWDTGTIGGFENQTDFLRRFGQKVKSEPGEYYFSKVRAGLLVSLFSIGAAIGGIVLGKIGDVYGRKTGLIVVVSIYLVGIVISIASINKWYQYAIGRIVSGFGCGGIAIFSPMLISEISPKHLRGTLVSCYQLMITAGIFLGYCTNYGTHKGYTNSVQWRVPLGLCFAWGLFMIFGTTLVPESPRFLIEVGRIEDAKRSIAVSNKLSIDDPSIAYEVEIILAGVEAERAAGQAEWGEIFSTKTKILQRLFMGCMLQMIQQLTGCNYFFYYGTTIFKAVGMQDSFQTAIVFGIVNFASTFIALYVVDRFGRRKCLLWGSALMTTFLVVFASIGVTKLWPEGPKHQNIASKGAGNAMIAFACFFIASFACTWAPIPFVVNAESYPLRVKAKCMALATATNWLWTFLIGFFTPFITGAINFYYGYVFMGCVCFSWFFVFFTVLETKGLSLEDVNTMWLEGTLAWKSPSWIPPAQRGVDYDQDALNHDDAPMYKRMFGGK